MLPRCAGFVRSLFPRVLLFAGVLLLLSLNSTAVDSKADYQVPAVVKDAAGKYAVYVNETTIIGSQGSGVLLSKSGLVLTNWHVVLNALAKGTRNMDVDWLPYLPVLGTTRGAVVYASPELDLALVKLDQEPQEDGVKLADTVSDGDRIYPVGFTTGAKEGAHRRWWEYIGRNGVKRTIDTGEVVSSVPGYSYQEIVAGSASPEQLSQAIATLEDSRTRPHLGTDPDSNNWNAIESNAWVTAGQSGGPCFGDDGRLLALNHAAAWENGKFQASLHIPIELIRLFLVGVQDTGDVCRPIIDRFDQDGGSATVGLPYESSGRPLCRRAGDGLLQQFKKDSEESGIALGDGGSEAFWVHGAIWAHYASHSGPDYIGYPRSEEYDVPEGRRQDFERGTLSWDRNSGQVELVTENRSSADGTSTVFVVDCSGSMGSCDQYGQQKLEAAKEAARRYLRIISFDESNLSRHHRVGIVSFSDDAYPTQDLTQNIDQARAGLDGLNPMASTNFGSALDTSISWLESASEQDSKTRKIIVFLSDGMTNTGPVSRDEFLVDRPNDFGNSLRLYQRLSEADIAVYTIGFGVKPGPGEPMTNENIDEEVLHRVAEVPGTGGGYFEAADSFELDEIYESSFHRATGTPVLDTRGVISQGERKLVGSFDPSAGMAGRGNLVRQTRSTAVPFLVTPAYADNGSGNQLLVTLGWVRGKLGLEIRDPSGKVVDESYPGSHVSTDSQPICLAVDRPRTGKWTATVLGKEVTDPTTRYHLVVSARAPQFDYQTGAAAAVGGIISICAVAAMAAVLMGMKNRTRMALRAAANAGQPAAQFVSPPPVAKASKAGVEAMELVNEADGRVVSLARGLLLIGRSPQCDLVLADRDVSAKHAIITRTGRGWSLEDVRSRNGTYVNGQKISHGILADDDVIRLGSTKLRFRRSVSR